MQEPHFKNSFGQDSTPVQEKTITLEPGEGRSIGLGVYDNDYPVPSYEITMVPDLGLDEDIALAQDCLDIPGESRYMLLYQFHNFGTKTCKITMRRTTSRSRHGF